MSNISSIRPGSSGDGGSGKIDRNRPQGQPRTDNFRKLSSKDRRAPDKEPADIETEEETPDDSPRSLFDLSRKSKSPIAKPKGNKQGEGSASEAASKMRTPASETSAYASVEEEPEEGGADQDLGALASKKGAATQQTPMTGKTEVKDTRLFENVLAKTTDKVSDEELSGKKGVKGEGAGQKKLAANELGRQQADQVQAMKSDREDTSESQSESLSAASKKEKAKKAASEDAEKDDITKLAAVNATIQGVGLGADKTGLKETGEVARSATIRDIAAQIVEKVQIMKDSDTTRTIVTLRHPPILSGATVTLVVSDNAKNELNISFANLSPDAKMFLDRKLNEDSLTQTLERKGIVVHMITTKTEPEINLQAGQPTREDQQQQQRDQSQQQQQREREQQQEEQDLE